MIIYIIISIAGTVNDFKVAIIKRINPLLPSAAFMRRRAKILILI